MSFKAVLKTAGVLGISIGLIASPLAFAQSSIERTKDRAVGSDVIDMPQSTSTSSPHYSPSELNHSQRDHMNGNYAPSSQLQRDQDGAQRRNTHSFESTELNHKEGDSLDW
ncbi:MULTISPECIES: hypothetical protein [Halomonas]|uniref:hypothetical protein n=1 Tax=Halomonas TaxID=2745 RepID=UPI00186879E4|nr:hypothetical protein [Halomonas citrativorans]